MQIGLEIRVEPLYNRIANNPSWRFFQHKALADKTAGVFFIFSAILKTAIGKYHKSDCNQSRGLFDFFIFFELTFWVGSAKIIVGIMQETHNRVSSETPYYQICWMAKCCPAFLKVRCIFYARNLEESHCRAVF